MVDSGKIIPGCSSRGRLHSRGKPFNYKQACNASGTVNGSVEAILVSLPSCAGLPIKHK